MEKAEAELEEMNKQNNFQNFQKNFPNGLLSPHEWLSLHPPAVPTLWAQGEEVRVHHVGSICIYIYIYIYIYICMYIYIYTYIYI